MAWAGWTGVLVAGIVLAGCSGAPEPAADGGRVLGSVAGVVVDEAVRPVAGARVSVPALPDRAPASTADDGTFRLDGLAPGVVLLQVEKAGFLSAVAQVEAVPGEPTQVATVTLLAAAETKPYIVQESFDGVVSCGLGSAPAFGLTAPCEQLAGSALAVVCRGQDPVPPTGVCLASTDPYYPSLAVGNLTMAQTELTWDPSFGEAELMVIQWAVAPDGQLIKGIGGATGPPFVVSRLNSTVLDEYKIGGENTLSLYVSVGNGPAANVVLQQPFRLLHTTAYFFEFEPEWTFIEDGAPLVPPACTTCLSS